jgi:hypothetical protein
MPNLGHEGRAVWPKNPKRKPTMSNPSTLDLIRSLTFDEYVEFVKFVFVEHFDRMPTGNLKAELRFWYDINAILAPSLSSGLFSFRCYVNNQPVETALSRRRRTSCPGLIPASDRYCWQLTCVEACNSMLKIIEFCCFLLTLVDCFEYILWPLTFVPSHKE